MAFIEFESGFKKYTDWHYTNLKFNDELKEGKFMLFFGMEKQSFATA